MSTIGTLGFIAALLFSIGLHELGHLATAKASGMKVYQYFIGFGPKLWSTMKGETEYGVRVLPLGGFVKIAGMNPFEETPPEDADRVFQAKGPWQRATVLAAGSITHFILGFLIIALVFALTPRLEPTLEIGALSEEFDGGPSPSVVAGFQEGDVLVSIDGQRPQDWGEAVELLRARPGEEIPVVVERAGTTITLTPTLADHRPNDAERIGFLGVGPTYAEVEVGVLVAIGDAGTDTVRGMWLSLKGLGEIFTPSRLGELFSQLTGNAERSVDDPTSIVGITGQAGDLASRGDFASFFLLIAAFNIFIGVANLLPLPPLDGGHLAVLAWEQITRKKVDVRKLVPVSATVISVFGMLFLMLLFLDITQPVRLPQ